MVIKKEIENEKKIRYIGNGNEIRIKVRFEPKLIRGITSEGNQFLWTYSSGKTWIFKDSTWNSNVSKYEITDGGVSLDEINHEVIIGNSSYINTSGKAYQMMIYDEDGDE